MPIIGQQILDLFAIDQDGSISGSVTVQVPNLDTVAEAALNEIYASTKFHNSVIWISQIETASKGVEKVAGTAVAYRKNVKSVTFYIGAKPFLDRGASYTPLLVLMGEKIMDIITLGQPTNSYQQWCLVYDARDGRVVHIHQFIALDAANACSPEELEKQALNNVVHCDDPSYLKVLHPSVDMRPDPFMVYRINPKDGTLQVSPRSIPEELPMLKKLSQQRKSIPVKE